MRTKKEVGLRAQNMLTISLGSIVIIRGGEVFVHLTRTWIFTFQMKNIRNFKQYAKNDYMHALNVLMIFHFLQKYFLI